MKRLLLLALALALAPLAGAQLYKHVDKDGKVTYSDQPPVSGDAKQMKVAPPSAPAGAKSYVAQDKDLDKKRKEANEKQGKADEKAQQDKQAEQRCAQARDRHQYFVDGGRILKNNEKGERAFMSDEEIAAERERSRREMEEACKGR